MKILNFLFAFAFLILVIGCGDDNCEKNDWIGTYINSSQSCSDPTSELDQQIIITSGPGDLEIIASGETLTITDCTATGTGLASLVTLTLDGDNLNVSILDCTGDYVKQ